MRIYALTIFLGAFLLFQIEPIVAKFILPWFGGAPTVWTTCLLFFQVLLLAGYTYAHLIGTRLSPRRQTMIHLGLIAICIAVMMFSALLWKSPIMPRASWKPAHEDFPAARILLVLSASIGLPYFALSATAPLLQSWFTRVHRGASPYRLYSVSNFGSLIALIAYPFAVEPNLSLKSQANLWSYLYVAFAIGMVLCAIPLLGAQPLVREKDEEAVIENRSRGTRTLWVVLPACASLLLYGATGQMMQDTAPIPFLWILPLALYLLSFIICFDSEQWYRRGIFHPLLGIAIFTSFLLVIYVDRIAAAVGRVVLSPTTVTLLLEIGNSSLLMFAGCMVCHGELVRLKPHRRDLTVFYLMVSAGGAVGGIFSVVVAPLLFSAFWDFRFAVWACVGLMTIALMRDRASWIYRRTPAAGIAILAAALAFPLIIGIVVHTWIYAAVAFAVVAAVALLVRRKDPPWRLAQAGIVTQLSMAAAIAVLGIVYIDTIAIAMHDTVWMTRNFYGVFRVVGEEAPDHRWHSYQLMNGPITHGKQFFSSTYPRMRYYPTTYYCLNSGIGLLLMNYPRGAENSSLRVGVVGLGVGTIAAWGRPGDDYRFYEINPAVVDAATNPNGYFSFLRDSSAHVTIVPGDARLSMEREVAEGHSQQFDVLAIDAFNGDTVPMHLLTREAMLIYLSELKPDGVLAIHVSNLYLDLRPVLAEHSRDLNLRYGFVHVDEKDLIDWASDWVLLSRNDKVLSEPEISGRLEPRDKMRRVRPWTDDYSNLFQLLK
ncbi:MAG: hypothetical protein ACLQAT_03245 [Candidatus Binataceae bacterium]